MATRSRLNKVEFALHAHLARIEREKREGQAVEATNRKQVVAAGLKKLSVPETAELRDLIVRGGGDVQRLVLSPIDDARIQALLSIMYG